MTFAARAMQDNDKKLHKWALERFKGRERFSYPTVWQAMRCCRQKEISRRIRFAKIKTKKDLDVARFINQKRETYISYTANMSCSQQVMCQKLAQITYDDSLSSQDSSD